MILKLSNTCTETASSQTCPAHTCADRAHPHTHQTVSLQRFHQGVVRVHVQQESVWNVLHEVQVLESGSGLLTFFLGRSALAGGALQVELQVHAEDAGQDVIHHHDPDVLPAGLNAVQTEELGQQGARILVQVLRERKHRLESLGLLVKQKNVLLTFSFSFF